MDEEDVKIKIVNMKISDTFLNMSDQQKSMFFVMLIEYINSNLNKA